LDAQFTCHESLRLGLQKLLPFIQTLEETLDQGDKYLDILKGLCHDLRLKRLDWLLNKSLIKVSGDVNEQLMAVQLQIIPIFISLFCVDRVLEENKSIPTHRVLIFELTLLDLSEAGEKRSQCFVSFFLAEVLDIDLFVSDILKRLV
jgi:hypothetical protein